MQYLLSGICCLGYYNHAGYELNQRYCRICKNNEMEDLMHFIMKCKYFDNIRRSMFVKISEQVSQETLSYYNTLSCEIRFYTLLGMTIDVPVDDLFKIRIVSSYYIHVMYNQRRKLEKNIYNH